ncbi:MAG: hypothetical protein H7Y11_11885, partial [Armatimonadetes bacterium]|nr:hypothetical protein [Anaerolineae bacterium]
MTMPSAPVRTDTSSLTLTGLLGDFRLLLILFVSFRILLALAYEPLLLESGERGLTVGGDRAYHYALSELSAQGDYPFQQWWSEFPPVWYTLTVGVYQMLGANVSYGSWALITGLILLVCDVGNLVLMRAIGGRLHGANTGMALAWVYALLLAPVVFTWWNFDGMVTLTLLLSLWWLLQGRDTPSAVMATVGALVKFTPA